MFEGKRTVFWDVTPCILIDENVLYETVSSIFYHKMEAGCSFETSMNIYQSTRRHIQESPDFDTAGRRRRLEDILQAILKK